MGTRWKTQSLHSICYPSSTSKSDSTLTSTSTPTSPPAASTLTHSLHLHLARISVSSPSPHPSPPLSPPPLPSSLLGPVSASASASASVSASTSPRTVRIDSDSFTKPLLRPLSAPRPLSRLRSHSSSSLSRLRIHTPDILTSADALPSTAAMPERPAIYVHFEFGVSWTPRHASRSRQVTYMSRSLRDRATEFPRQLPPPNTNFLANTQPQAEPSIQPQFHNVQSINDNLVPIHLQAEPPRDVVAINQPHNGTTLGNIQHEVQPQRPPSPNQGRETLHPRRSSRTQSRNSHERGRSAPPPFSNNPWDTNPDSSVTGSVVHNLPRDQRPRVAPEVWKALPATPNQFRLGEDGMPWSSWTFPMGYADDDNSENDNFGGDSDPLLAPEMSSSTLTRQAETSDRDRGREKEMQSLAAALVTVDNGFEDQWWYQGSRLVHVAGSILPTTSTNQPVGLVSAQIQSDVNDNIGWEVSNRHAVNEEEMDTRNGDGGFHPSWRSVQGLTPRSSVVDIVSPMSDFSSPVSGYQRLHRSLTTRSDELHM